MSEKKDSGTHIPTVQNPKPLFSFGVITDIQYADNEHAGTRYYRSSLTKLREALNTFKADSVDFIVNLGDLIDKDFDSFKPVINILDSSGLMIYNITGNHDYSVDPRYKKKLPVPAQSKEGYYSMVQNKFRFIFLNGNEISTYSATNKASIKRAVDFIADLKNKGETNAIEWNGGIGSKQLEWLSNQLDEATKNGEKVLILCHFPLVPDNQHNLLNYKDVLLVLGKYTNISAWFNGHNHAGNYGNFNMIHFVTFKGMVETESTNSYARVDVYSNKLWINGFGKEKSQILAY